jgi:hypothetical protein
MSFNVGQKVVRVARYTGWETKRSIDFPMDGPPIIGNIYTIRAINIWPTWTCLRFHEFDNSHLIPIVGCRIEPGWNSLGFRPLIEHKTDISIFTKILDDVRGKEPVA